MNNIPIKQNELKELQRLAAQRELYSSAKTFQGWQIFLNMFVPVTLALLIFKWDHITPFAALYGIISAILDPIFFDKAIETRRNKAAKIQELFDCDVLELKSSPFKLSNDDMVEDVLTHYNAHSKISTNIEKIKDWYPNSIGQLPIQIARLICQRTNCYWDSRLRKRYSVFIGAFGVCLFIIFMFAGLLLNKAFVDLVLMGSALVPFIQFCLKQCKDQKEAADRLDILVNFAKEIWEKDLNKQQHELDEISRRLQDEIFNHRSKSPLILDFIYNRFRTKDESIMDTSAEALIANARLRNII